jgi:hypothetical protein
VIALHVDLGLATDMQRAVDHARLIGVEVETRRILGAPAGRDPRELLAGRRGEVLAFRRFASAHL